MSVSPRDVERHCEIARRAHVRLLTALRDLLDAGTFDADGPTLLGGWTRAMLVTHLARNADSHRRMFEAAAVGQVSDQYPGGLGQRNSEIDDGRGRPGVEVIDDLAGATARLEATWSATDWQGAGRRSRGATTPVTDLPFLRLREVELHHVDLDVGTTFDDLDPTYVRLELSRLTMLWSARQPMGMTSLPASVLERSPGDRLAWLTGRLEIDGRRVEQMF